MATSDHLPAEGESTVVDGHDLAQTLEQIEKGEKTAARLESNLTSLEKKIDDLLACFEESEQRSLDEANAKKAAGEPSGGTA
ncbi:hypothetical protein BUE80_DR001917 [Diplocarpon rosae]|nr:hypothetical protein BUE80_DR001917 [Diplocarpon rosae]